MTAYASTHPFEYIQSHFIAGRIPRYGPILILVARSAFILIAQGLTFLLFLSLNVPNPSVVIRNWWPVYGTLVDFGCLGLLAWLTRREGICLFDLIGLMKSKLKTEIPLGLGLFILIFPVAMLGGGALAQLVVYGSLNLAFPQYIFSDRVLPLLPLLYTRILW